MQITLQLFLIQLQTLPKKDLLVTYAEVLKFRYHRQGRKQSTWNFLFLGLQCFKLQQRMLLQIILRRVSRTNLYFIFTSLLFLQTKVFNHGSRRHYLFDFYVCGFDIWGLRRLTSLYFSFVVALILPEIHMSIQKLIFTCILTTFDCTHKTAFPLQLHFLSRFRLNLSY